MKKKKWLWIGLGVLVVLFAISAGAGEKKKSSNNAAPASLSANSENPPAADVVVDSCAVSTNTFEGPEAKLSVTNHSSKTSNYAITVAFDSRDGGQQLDTGAALVQTLAPGQTTQTTASSLKSELRTSGKFTCKVAEVNRYAS